MNVTNNLRHDELAFEALYRELGFGIFATRSISAVSFSSKDTTVDVTM
jgi:hypothetical protein